MESTADGLVPVRASRWRDELRLYRLYPDGVYLRCLRSSSASVGRVKARRSSTEAVKGGSHHRPVTQVNAVVSEDAGRNMEIGSDA